MELASFLGYDAACFLFFLGWVRFDSISFVPVCRVVLVLEQCLL